MVLPAPAAPSITSSWRVAGERGDDRALRRVESRPGRRARSMRIAARRAASARRGERGAIEVGLDVEHRAARSARGRARARRVAVEQRHAPADGAGGQVLGQLAPHRGVGDQTSAAGDQLLDLAADVGGVPGRPARPEPRRHLVDRPRRGPCRPRPASPRGAGLGRVAVAELVQLVDPPLAQFRAVASARPCPGRASAQARASHARRNAGPGSSPGLRGAPLGLVAVDVAADLRGPGAERADERRPARATSPVSGSRVNPCAASAARNSRVGHHRGVPDAVDRVDAVAHPDRVQPAPARRRRTPGR